MKRLLLDADHLIVTHPRAVSLTFGLSYLITTIVLSVVFS